jgi:hypothetical protein
MAVYVSNIVIEQGFDFDTSFQLEDTRSNSLLDLSGTSSLATLKKTYTSSSSVSFASTVTSPTEGIISISLTANQTAVLKPGRYVYDVKILTQGGKELKAVEGSALVRPGVTL